MNFAFVKKRLGEVVRTDAISDSNHDFLATHVPLRKITLGHGLIGDSKNRVIPEREVYGDIFGASGIEQHQLVIVEGAAGSGKSHFIRWLDSQLHASEDISSKNAILLIKRKDNTLKGTIRQLLSIPAIQHIRNKDVYERLIKADRAISEAKFKDEILYKFVIEVQNDESESGLERRDRKGLVSLLQTDLFQARLKESGAPIDRLYSKINGGNGVIDGSETLFTKTDFVFDMQFVDQLEEVGADSRARQIVDRLIPDSLGESDILAESLANYLNGFVNGVVRALTGIEPGDFEQIFESIRQELKTKGMGLILLIEDITAFYGIDQSLLNALVVEHTGLNESSGLCRLISVIGTTSQYYGEFRDHYKQRITAQITIGDDAIGSNPEDLYLFFAKYLNAMSLSEATVKEWYESGANDEDLPIHISTEEIPSDYVEINGKQCSIYPFTKTAIRNLYNLYPGSQKTPRYILKQIIAPAVNEAVWKPESYMSFCNGAKGNMSFSLESRIINIINNLNGVSDDEKEKLKPRVLSFVAFYGCGNLNANTQSISKVKRNLFLAFGMEAFEKRVVPDSQEDTELAEEQPEDVYMPPSQPADSGERKKYDTFVKQVDDWKRGKGLLFIRRTILDPVNDFVWNTLNWEQNGVPLWIKDAAENTLATGRRLISFENQDSNITGLITLKPGDETYRLLLAFGQWHYLGDKSWSFDGGFEQMFFVTSWLEKHKKEIVDSVLNGVGVPIETVALCAMSLEALIRLLAGSIEPKMTAITESVFYSPMPNITEDDLTGHSKEWIDVYSYLSRNAKEISLHSTLLNFFSLIVPGTAANAAKVHVIKSIDFVSCLRKCKKANFNFAVADKPSRYKDVNVLLSLYSDALSKVNKLLSAEIASATGMVDLVYGFFGYKEMGLPVETDDISELLNSIIAFYAEVHSAALAVSSKKEDAESLLPASSSIAKAMRTIESNKSASFESFVALSANPMRIINPFVALCENVQEDVNDANRYVDSQKEQLLRSGRLAEDEVDPRFSSIGEKFYDKANALEEFKDA